MEAKVSKKTEKHEDIFEQNQVVKNIKIITILIVSVINKHREMT